MQPIGIRRKHLRFKMRATEDLPYREFAVEFTASYFDIRKIGKSYTTERVRWVRLIGSMLIFGDNAEQATLGEDARGFLVEISSSGHESVTFQVEFGENGLSVLRDGVSTIWSWRTILSFALMGGGG